MRRAHMRVPEPVGCYRRVGRMRGTAGYGAVGDEADDQHAETQADQSIAEIQTTYPARLP